MFGSFMLAMFFSVTSSFQLVTVLSSGLVASILLQCLRAYGVHIFDGSNGFIMDLSIQVHFKGAFADSCCIDHVSLCLLYFYGIMLCRSVTLSQHLNTSPLAPLSDCGHAIFGSRASFWNRKNRASNDKAPWRWRVVKHKGSWHKLAHFGFTT